MNETLLNNSVVKTIGGYLTTVIKNGTEKVTDTVKNNVPTIWMANIIIAIIAFAVIFIASKITQKFAKFILYILGIILLVGLGLNIFMG